MQKVASYITPLVERRLEEENRDCNDHASRPVETVMKSYSPVRADPVPARLRTMGHRFFAYAKTTNGLKDCSTNDRTLVRICAPATHGMTANLDY